MSKTDCEADGWHVANDDTQICDETETCWEYKLTDGTCVTKEACKTTYAGFILEADKACLTESECTGKTTASMIYTAAAGVCTGVADCTDYELTDGTCVTDTACKNTHSGYLHERDSVKKCLSKTECTAEADYYVDETDRKCVFKEECQWSKFTFGEGETKVCLTDVQCEADLKHTANSVDHTCDAADCQGYTFTDESGTECVNEATCTYTKNGLLYKNDAATEKLCLADEDACAKKGGFVLENKCLTEE